MGMQLTVCSSLAVPSFEPLVQTIFETILCSSHEASHPWIHACALAKSPSKMPSLVPPHCHLQCRLPMEMISGQMPWLAQEAGERLVGTQHCCLPALSAQVSLVRNDTAQSTTAVTQELSLAALAEGDLADVKASKLPREAEPSPTPPQP